jgi:hypothetical protein
VSSLSGTAKLTRHGKLAIAQSMFGKGCAFSASYVLLLKVDRSEPTEYVALHNLCQSIEIVLKSCLLFRDYDRFKPHFGKRGGYNHDLIKLSNDTLSEFSLHKISDKSSQELKQLNDFYRNHHLRYGSGVDLFIAPSNIERLRIFRLLKRVIKLAVQHS